MHNPQFVRTSSSAAVVRPNWKGCAPVSVYRQRVKGRCAAESCVSRRAGYELRLLTTWVLTATPRARFTCQATLVTQTNALNWKL